MFSDAVKEVLRAVSGALQIPTIVILLILIAVTVVMLGSIIGEFFTERKQLKVRIPLLIDDIQGRSAKETGAIYAWCTN